MNSVRVLAAFILVLSINALVAGTIIGNFKAVPGLNKVVLSWTSEKEDNLRGFDVERSLENKTSTFRNVDFVTVSTDGADKKEYTYEDRTVFKGSDRTYYYRLKIIDNDNTSTYSEIISVSPTISSARQTWGSIKAMFR